MDIFSRETLIELARIQSEHTVSLFIPTHRAGPDSRPFATEDVIRWKSLLRQATDRLESAGICRREADALLQPAHDLTGDAVFWQYQSDGLAAFVAPGLLRTFRVPIHLEELVVVAPRLQTKPLLPLLVGDGRFYVLALSQNRVRLLDATRDAASEVDLAEAPASLQEALRFDDPERQLQWHTGAPRSGARRTAVFHGHGVGTDDRKDRVLRFCQQIDRGLTATLRGSGAPLVLAAVESVAAIYRQANSYPHLVDQIVPGNPDERDIRELHAAAWPLVDPLMQRERQAAVERYLASRGTAKATDDLVTALEAAADGRVDVAFVPIGVQRWGTFVDTTREMVLHGAAEPGDEDLLNVLAVRTILAGGTVYAVPPSDMPAGGIVAGLLRY